MVFRDSPETTKIMFPGDDCEEATPVPIPNTAVKLLRADNTWGVALWEGRYRQDYFFQFCPDNPGFFFLSPN